MGLTMQEKKAVTRETTARYQKATKKEKQSILDEFVQLTGYHRKYAIRILGTKPVTKVTIYKNGGAVVIKPEKKKRSSNRKGKRKYNEEVIRVLRLLWVFFHFKCGKILAPLMRQQIHFISEWQAFHITPEIAKKLMEISPATIDRSLKKDKQEMKLKGKSLTKPLVGLKSRIPIRTFYSSDERKTPGFWQIDTVHHCGSSTSGEYIHTLTLTDVSSGWIELRPLLNNAHKWALEALTEITSSLPLPVLEFHSDNGSEFINNTTEIWCKKESIRFTRSRSHQKNDNCFVEQKNGAVVREYVGYYRLEGQIEQELVANIYRSLVPLLNFFMPTQKLVSKTRIGSKEIKKYDEHKSPYQRLMDSKLTPNETKDALRVKIALYNPVELQDNVNKAILCLMRRLAQPNRKVC